MIDLIEIDECINRINNTYNTNFVYKILKINQFYRHFADLKITNEHPDFEGWYYNHCLFYNFEFSIFDLYDNVVESWVEIMYENK